MSNKDTKLYAFSIFSFIKFGIKIQIKMEIKIRPYKTKDTQAILDVINYNILNSSLIRL
jgi:hypothetical protein